MHLLEAVQQINDRLTGTVRKLRHRLEEPLVASAR